MKTSTDNSRFLKLFSIAFLLIILNSNVAGRTGRPAKSEVRDSSKIALSDILGDWYPIDSSAAPQITFRQIGVSLVEIDGIKHGVGNYTFRMDKDSISVNGIAMNWPPYDCTLRLLNRNLLEIEFYQFFYTTSSKIIYKR